MAMDKLPGCQAALDELGDKGSRQVPLLGKGQLGQHHFLIALIKLVPAVFGT
jgi:hypothetical protein